MDVCFAAGAGNIHWRLLLPFDSINVITVTSSVTAAAMLRTETHGRGFFKGCCG